MTEIKAHLTNIKEQIETELLKAKQSILVASAYFKDEELANLLIQKAKSGLSVDLIISDSKKVNDDRNPVDFDAIIKAGINFYRLGEEKSNIMHHKFCIIDSETVITGSYNWTHGAKGNEENIVIFKDKTIAEQYQTRYYELRALKPTFNSETLEIDVNIHAKNTLVRKNELFKIDWATQNANLVTINGVEKNLSDTDYFTITEDTIFVLEAKNTETDRQKSKSILIRVVKPINITFEIENEFIIRSQSTTLRWKVENAESIEILPTVGIVDNDGKRKINPSESTVYRLVATDKLNEITEKQILINVYPTPVIEHLIIPSPTDIRIEAVFETLSHTIPSTLNLSNIKHQNFDFPRLLHINTNNTNTKPTVKQVSEILKVHTNDLYRSIGEVENLKMRLFDWLEKIFNNNPKMTEIVKTIRKHYG